jgi:hypothetical protein
VNCVAPQFSHILTFAKENNMKLDKRHYLVPLLIAALALVSFPGCHEVFGPHDEDDDSDERIYNTHTASEAFLYQITPGHDQHLKIEGVNGPINIIGDPNASGVELSGQRIVGGNSARDAADNLEKLQVTIITGSDGILVKTEQPDQTKGRNFEVRYFVRIPDTWSIDVKLVNGETRIDSLSAEANIDLVNGNIRIEEHFGDLDIDLVNGNIISEVTMPVNGQIDIETVNGGIDLNIPVNTSAQVQAKIANGMIALHNLSMSVSYQTRNRLEGTLGGGRGEIELKATNGTIDLYGF